MEMMAQLYSVILPQGFGAVTSAPTIVDAEQQIVTLQTELRSAKRMQATLLLGGAAAAIVGMILDYRGYKAAATALSITSVIGGAVFAALQLFEEDKGV